MLETEPFGRCWWRDLVVALGLEQCDEIVAPSAPTAAPARLLQDCAARVVWLLDDAAAAGLAD